MGSKMAAEIVQLTDLTGVTWLPTNDPPHIVWFLYPQLRQHALVNVSRG